MADSNPYEAPDADLNPTPRDGVTERERLIARRMLEARRKGYTIGLVLRWTSRRYVLRLLLFAAVLAVLAGAGLLEAFWLVLGFGLGMTLQDVAWIRAASQTWTVTVRITDWRKVERLAEGEPIDGA